MKRIIRKLFIPAILTSLTGTTMLFNNYNINIKTNNLGNNQEKSFETIQKEALSIFVEFYFQEDFKIKFQEKYLQNLENNLPDTMPSKYDIAKEMEKFIYKKYGIKIKLEIANEYKTVQLANEDNNIEINKASLLFMNNNWIDLYPHNYIRILWNNERFYELYEEWRSEMKYAVFIKEEPL